MTQMHESDVFHMPVTDLDFPIFTEASTITIQPQISGDFPGSRRPIPVSTIDWRTTNLVQFTPMCGLDFLTGAEEVYIQQTFELNDLLANVESENRYTIKVPQGETLYLANETSTSAQRMLFGSQRAFSMRLYDQTRQESLSFIRNFACTNCLCGCYLQELQVWIPPGELLGVIKQDWTFMSPTFSVVNDHNNIIYKIEAPQTYLDCSNKDAHFKIYSPDRTMELGNIRHQWDQILVDYNLSLRFPSRESPTKDKALLLGAAFLLEYLYFEKKKHSKICRCGCIL